MSQTSSTRRPRVAREHAAAATSSQAEAEFKAECEALSAAVADNLDVASRPDAKPKADGVVVEEVAANLPQGKVSVVAAKPVYYPGEMEFVPNYSFVLKHAGAELQGDAAEEVTISRQLLDFMLRCLLDRMDFDEQQYQKCNPDVAAAIRRREMHSGRDHFIKTGYFEGRSGGVRVDEAWYLARNPDVAAAKKAGKFLSGSAQYRLAGASEWRAPNPQSEVSVGMWNGVLKR